MLSNALSVLGYICAAAVMDWLFTTEIGARFSDFDYRYWPLSPLRWAGVIALISAAAYLWSITGTNGPTSALIPFGVLIIIYVGTVLGDVSAQRRAGYKKPPNPRYSDGEYGS